MANPSNCFGSIIIEGSKSVELDYSGKIKRKPGKGVCSTTAIDWMLSNEKHAEMALF